MSLFGDRRVWMYREPIDFRKQVNGLVQHISEGSFEANDGSIYVFRNRQKNKIKMVMWHLNGFFLGSKRLEKGRFDFPANAACVEMITEQLLNLLSGMPMIYQEKGAERLTIYA